MASPTRPTEPEALRKWIWGIVRNKVADYHRKARRESFDLPEIPASSRFERAREANDLLRWAVGELPPGRDAEQTFEWLLREGEGEKLESIAGGEKLPPARVRQRVSRLRRHFRARWEAQVAALAALGILGIVVAIWMLRTRRPEPPPIAHENRPVPSSSPPLDRAIEERDQALALCDREQWGACLDKLDHAASLDPAIETDPKVVRARAAASAGISRNVRDVMTGPSAVPSASPSPSHRPESSAPSGTPIPTGRPPRPFGSTTPGSGSY